MDRRTALIRITAIAGGIAATLAAIPFVRYFYPSAKAKALGSAVSVDLADLRPGQIKSVTWRGRPILIMRRDPKHVAGLTLSNDRLLDDDPEETQPSYVDATHRAIDANFLVVIGNCSHLGCVPNQDIDTGLKLLGDWWPGGFHCPCHHSFYDYAGRVVRGPAPRNLQVPPHYFATETELIVGEDAPSA